MEYNSLFRKPEIFTHFERGQLALEVLVPISTNVEMRHMHDDERCAIY